MSDHVNYEFEDGVDDDVATQEFDNTGFHFMDELNTQVWLCYFPLTNFRALK
jgi:hypothetical protein